MFTGRLNTVKFRLLELETNESTGIAENIGIHRPPGHATDGEVVPGQNLDGIGLEHHVPLRIDLHGERDILDPHVLGRDEARCEIRIVLDHVARRHTQPFSLGRLDAGSLGQTC